MNWFILGATFDVVGKILIGVAVLLVHQSIMEEHKITRATFKQMRREKIFGFLGIIFILIGYLVHIFSL